jgi:hypothetical protein
MKNGTITPKGIDLEILTVGADKHERMMRNGEFEACEIGLFEKRCLWAGVNLFEAFRDAKR